MLFLFQANQEAISEMAAIPVVNYFGEESRVNVYLCVFVCVRVGRLSTTSVRHLSFHRGGIKLFEKMLKLEIMVLEEKSLRQ